MTALTARPLHLIRYYAAGIGHIDAREGRYRVSFYGRRVRQAWADSLADARRALRQLAAEAN